MRSESKRYGTLFTCLVSQGSAFGHMEVTSAMDLDTFIMALMRFLVRHGIMRSIRSDNGTNFASK